MTSLADWLTLATEQLNVARERVNQAGVTADDMAAVGAYLLALGEQGHHVSALALRVVEQTTSDRSDQDALHGMDLETALAHASAMFHAVIHFAHEVKEAADAIAQGEENS